MEVIVEKKDYKHFNQDQVNNFYNKSKENATATLLHHMDAFREGITTTKLHNQEMYDMERIIEDSNLENSSYFQTSYVTSKSEIPLSNHSESSNKNKFAEYDDYKVINEYSDGQFFGEIS